MFGKHRAAHADIARPGSTNESEGGGSVQPIGRRQVLGGDSSAAGFGSIRGQGWIGAFLRVKILE